MITFTVKPNPNHEKVVLDAYIPEMFTHTNQRIKMTAILILPGGGYMNHTPNECEEMAMRFCGEGYACFVLKYSVGEMAHFPNPLVDASVSLWHIRRNAEKWSIHPNRIVVMGFSAGAHLAGALATMWHYVELQKDGMPEGGNRPDACIFGYLPTTFEDVEEKLKQPVESLHFLGKEGRFSDVKSLTITNLVDKRTPPAFMWKNTAHIPESSFLYAEALKAAGVPYEVHVFTDHIPANGICRGWECSKNTKMWVELALNWLEYIFKMRTD